MAAVMACFIGTDFLSALPAGTELGRNAESTRNPVLARRSTGFTLISSEVRGCRLPWECEQSTLISRDDLICNQGVAGSNPAAGTRFSNYRKYLEPTSAGRPIFGLRIRWRFTNSVAESFSYLTSKSALLLDTGTPGLPR